MSDLRKLRRSERGYPARLRAIHDPPPQLWVRGSAGLELFDDRCLAIVGARSCSAYGRSVARSLAREAAAAGAVIVSGLARGIDGEAHRGALDATGRTVAVLGCGIDRDYPAAHRQLAAAIVEAGGLIVSEYEPGVEPAPWRFPARNRIISGVSLLTVVVEARERSGALITADFALEQGRDVMAVPGEITSAMSAGSNGLLRQGAAPVTRIEDVLVELGLEAAPARHDAAVERDRGEDHGGRGRAGDDRGRDRTGHGPRGRTDGGDSGLTRVGRPGLGERGRLSQYDPAMSSVPYWLVEDERPVASTPLDGPAEIEIVGGGITGVACAHALATAGVRVRLHDGRQLAGGASGRNGGFALTGHGSAVRRDGGLGRT